MPKITYTPRQFSKGSQELIEQVNEIIDEYEAQGLVLTLRQIYYQFVTRNIIRNNQKEYKRLGSVINDGRLAGLIDWDAIEDRTRNLVSNSHWESPQEIVEICARQYAIDKWAEQKYRVECWVEKEALAGVFEAVCKPLDVPVFPCRGYVSQSEMWGAAQRLRRYEKAGQECVILHFGDHDPSGIDMSRDIEDRLKLFRCNPEVRRLALNFDQIQQYRPPPNPAKATDARFASYQTQFGNESWELDALDPKTLKGLIEGGVFEYRDVVLWKAGLKEEETAKAVLASIGTRWKDVARFLTHKP